MLEMSIKRYINVPSTYVVNGAGYIFTRTDRDSPQINQPTVSSYDDIKIDSATLKLDSMRNPYTHNAKISIYTSNDTYIGITNTLPYTSNYYNEPITVTLEDITLGKALCSSSSLLATTTSPLSPVITSTVITSSLSRSFVAFKAFE